MARSTGGDIVLQLVAQASELKESMKQQSEHMKLVTDHTKQLGGQTRQLSEQTKQLSEHVRQLSEQTMQLSERVDQLGDDQTVLSASMKANVGQFARLAKLLSEFAKFTEDRFDEVDARLDRLEAASGK